MAFSLKLQSLDFGRRISQKDRELAEGRLDFINSQEETAI